MKKKILSIIISLAMIIGSFSMSFAVPADVVGTSFEDAVVRLESLGVLTGYPDGSFKPNDNIKRSEYAAVAVRAKQLQGEVTNNQASTIFADVSSNYWASGYINVAQEKGLIEGMGTVNGITKFAPEQNITYEQAVTIMVRALGYESAVVNAGKWYQGYLNTAAQEGLLQNTNGTIGSLATRGLVAQLTYNALNVPMMIKVGSNYIKSGTQGTQAVYLFNELNLINKAAASGNWGSINLQVFADAGIVGVTSGNISNLKSTLEALANGDNKNWSPSEIQGVFDTLGGGNKVIIAEATSATQFQVKFNTELNSADAITTAPYKVSISGVTFIGTPVLSEDGKVLTLTANSAMNLNNAAVIVEPIQTKQNSTVLTDRHTKLYSYSDSVKPTVKAITSKTNSNIANAVNVEFSEPIGSLGSVKIDGVVKSATGFTSGDSEANFTGLSLNASQSHTIQFINLRDQATNISSVLNETFSVEIDTVKPTVVLSASADKDNVIVFEFDKAVTTTTATASLVNGIVKNESLGNQGSSTAVPINPINGVTKKYEMAVTSPFGTLTTRNLTVLIPSGIKDVLGNEADTVTKTVTIKKDTIDPEIDLIRFIKDPNDNVIALIISTDSTLATKGNVNAVTLAPFLTVMDPNGVLVPSLGWLGGLSQDAIIGGNKEIKLSFATPGKLSDEYKITFASGLATDEADTPNNLKPKTVYIDFGPASTTGSFTILPVDVTSGGINVYNIDFGAGVRGGNVGGSATDLNNYTLNGSSLPLGTTITLNPTKDIATVTLPAESISVSDPGALFTINNVVRLSGETIVPFTTTVATVDNVKPLMASAILANDNRLIVEFSETLAAIPTSADFSIKINGKLVVTTPPFVLGTGSDAGKYVVDLNTLLNNDGTQTYIDIDGDSTYVAATDIFVLTEATQSSFSMKTSPIVSSLNIEVVAGATTDTATPANTIKIGTIITAK